MKKPKIEQISWSWKQRPYLDELRVWVEPFGLFVYEHPGYENMDQFCYLLVDRELTEAELKKIENDFMSDD